MYVSIVPVLRFVQGITAIGVFTNAFVWAMEIVGGKWQVSKSIDY